jgi:uncharacterized protein
MPADHQQRSTAIAEVETIYRELAARPVERACELRTECCQFQLTGRVPHLTMCEAIVAAKGLRASGRKELPEREDGACPLLDGKGRCLIYAARPFGCRTHFCKAAGGPMERRSVVDLIRRLDTLDAKLGGDGARQIGDAIEAALERFY